MSSVDSDRQDGGEHRRGKGGGTGELKIQAKPGSTGAGYILRRAPRCRVVGMLGCRSDVGVRYVTTDDVRRQSTATPFVHCPRIALYSCCAPFVLLSRSCRSWRGVGLALYRCTVRTARTVGASGYRRQVRGRQEYEARACACAHVEDGKPARKACAPPGLLGARPAREQARVGMVITMCCARQSGRAAERQGGRAAARERERAR